MKDGHPEDERSRRSFLSEVAEVSAIFAGGAAALELVDDEEGVRIFKENQYRELRVEAEHTMRGGPLTLDSAELDLAVAIANVGDNVVDVGVEVMTVKNADGDITEDDVLAREQAGITRLSPEDGWVKRSFTLSTRDAIAGDEPDAVVSAYVMERHDQ